jgi:8-oxo-dGTP pyrophosphatase MutT (NUDIX family)
MRRVGEEIRKAASVIVARDGAGGLEVLVLERGAASRFLPGYVAFPGGAADEADAALAEEWFGSATESARACAVRELLEEVGLALTANGLVESRDRSAGSISASPPRVEQLREVAHWVAPPQVPVRFDARYYATAAPGGLRVVPDGGETADAWWASPRDLLEDWRTRRRSLFWPTYFTIREIAPCGGVAELLAMWIDTREPDDDELQRLPRSTFWQEAG